MRHTSTSLAPYEQILFEDLRIPEEFLPEHEKTLNEKLRRAAADMERQDGDISAITQLIHLASSIVLRNAKYLDETLGKVRSMRGFEVMDPTTVLTVVTLYYLLRTKAQGQLGEAQTHEIERIRQRFNEINWLIGRDAMRALGFENGDN